MPVPLYDENNYAFTAWLRILVNHRFFGVCLVASLFTVLHLFKNGSAYNTGNISHESCKSSKCSSGNVWATQKKYWGIFFNCKTRVLICCNVQFIYKIDHFDFRLLKMTLFCFWELVRLILAVQLLLFVFCDLTSQSTAMVLSRLSVYLIIPHFSCVILDLSG